MSVPIFSASFEPELTFRRGRRKEIARIGARCAAQLGASERRQTLSLARPAQQGFDRHGFVDVTHADCELQRGEFTGFSTGVFNLIPANITASPMNFNAGLVLTDERIFGEGRKRSVSKKLFPAVNSLGALREDFDDQNHIVDFARFEIHRLAATSATHQQAG